MDNQTKFALARGRKKALICISDCTLALNEEHYDGYADEHPEVLAAMVTSNMQYLATDTLMDSLSALTGRLDDIELAIQQIQ